MIREEKVSVFVGVDEIYPDNINITLGIDKGYNTCTCIGVDLVGEAGDILKAIINEDEYFFYITEKNISEYGKISFTCKGFAYQLENQRESNDTLEYSDSDTLITIESGSVSVVNNLPNIQFGSQSYSKSATPILRILDMVNVVGGEAYEIDSTLILDEIKSIPETPVIAHSYLDSEIFSYGYSSIMQQSALAKQVLINPITDNIYEEPKITVEYAEDKGIVDVYFSPSLSSGEPYSFLGLVPTTPVNTTKVEKILLNSETIMRTIGGIDTVIYMNLDGEPLSSYTIYPTENVVRFDSTITGEIEIKYTTKYIRTYVTSTTRFSIKYKCAKCEDIISIDNNSYINSGTCKIDIGTPLTWQSGGSVTCYKDTEVTLIFVEEKGLSNIETVSNGTHAGGGILNIKYAYKSGLWSDISFMQNISSSVNTVIETTSGTVEYDTDLGVYLVYVPMRILSINSILEGSIALSGYTYIDGETPYITFLPSDVGRNVDISMNVEEVKINIPAPTTSSPVKLLDAIGCSGVATQEFTNDLDNLCSLPAKFTVNVAEKLNESISNTAGKVVTIDKGIGDKTVDNFGKIQVEITTADIYKIDCSSILAEASIVIDAKGVPTP